MSSFIKKIGQTTYKINGKYVIIRTLFFQNKPPISIMAKNKKVIKEQKKYQNLLERYEEMSDYLLDLIEKHERVEEELRYLHDFVHYQKPDEEFQYFREHAHEDENSELPFPYLVL